MKKKLIRLTESDLHSIITNCVLRVLKEDFDYDQFDGMSDEDFEELQRKFVDAYEKEDQDMLDDYNDQVADMYDYESRTGF